MAVKPLHELFMNQGTHVTSEKKATHTASGTNGYNKQSLQARSIIQEVRFSEAETEE